MDKFKRILVTGGAGFIGSNCINKLLEESTALIFNIDKLNYSSDPRFVKEKEKIIVTSII